jgi:hypothetical protein
MRLHVITIVVAAGTSACTGTDVFAGSSVAAYGGAMINDVRELRQAGVDVLPASGAFGIDGKVAFPLQSASITSSLDDHTPRELGWGEVVSRMTIGGKLLLEPAATSAFAVVLTAGYSGRFCEGCLGKRSAIMVEPEIGIGVTGMFSFTSASIAGVSTPFSALNGSLRPGEVLYPNDTPAGFLGLTLAAIFPDLWRVGLLIGAVLPTERAEWTLFTPSASTTPTFAGPNGFTRMVFIGLGVGFQFAGFRTKDHR